MTPATTRAALGTGALVWGGFDGAEAPGPFLDAVRDGRIGGVVIFAFRGNIRSKGQVRAMLREIQDAARRGGLPPVPVAVDQEGGSVIRIGYRAIFPSAMAIGATGDPSYAERAARAVGEGLRSDGIAVNHAPVCDVNSEPRNPVIGTRAFGDDPRRVADFAAAWVRGSEAARVATTPKHFPGHGHTWLDSHLTRLDVEADRATLESRELPPFRAAFAAGASGAMTAHIRYPALDAANAATVSRAIATDLLRGALGFRGLLVTDSLDMKGIAEVDSPDHVIPRCVAAGVDAVMVTTGFETQCASAAWIDAAVARDRVREAVARATDFRRRFGVDGGDDIDDEPARLLAREIADRSITHVGPALPRLGGPVRVYAFAPARQSYVEEAADPIGVLERALRAHLGPRLRFASGGPPPDGDGTLVVCSSNAAFAPDQAARVRELLATGGVLCALRSPYDAALAPAVPALLSYGDVPASLEAIAAVLAGEASARGRSPVQL